MPSKNSKPKKKVKSPKKKKRTGEELLGKGMAKKAADAIKKRKQMLRDI